MCEELHALLGPLHSSWCRECLRQIREESNSQGVRKAGKWQRLWEVKTQRLQVQKAQNLRKNWRVKENLMSLYEQRHVHSSSEHGITAAPPQICSAFTGVAGSAERAN